MDDIADAERAQAERLAKLGQVSPPAIGAAVSFGAVTVHSASLLADLFGEPEPEPEFVAAAVPLPGARRGAGGSVSVNVDTLVGELPPASSAPRTLAPPQLLPSDSRHWPAAPARPAAS